MPTDKGDGRIMRLWVVVHAMLDNAHVGISLSDLSALTGVSRWTTWRDLQVLAAAGIPFEEETVEGGEKLLRLERTRLPRLLLLPRHVQAVEVARRVLSDLEGTTLLDAYDDILARIGRPISKPELSPEERAVVEMRRLVERGFERGVRLRIAYVNVGEAAPRTREIDPLSWRFVRDEVYLLAFDHAKGQTRSYATTRLRGVEVTDIPVLHAPEPPAAPWFSPADDLESLPIETVEIRLSPICAAQLASRPLHPSQIVTPQADGTALLTARVAGLWRTAEWISIWGAEVCPLSPPALVEMMRERARRNLAAWGG